MLRYFLNFRKYAYEWLLQHPKYLAKMGKTIEWGFADPMHLFIKYSIFHNYWPEFWPRFWDIFSISGNALMNHFFSIVISCEKAKYDCAEVLRIQCTFSSNIQFFIIFGPNLGPDFEIFSQFQEMPLWISSSASCYLAKKQKTVLWGYADPMHLFIKHSIFHN